MLDGFLAGVAVSRPHDTMSRRNWAVDAIFFPTFALA
jgi:hypothetical protein